MAGKAELLFTEYDDAFVKRLEKELAGVFSKGDSVAVKLHMGERKNPNHLKPAFVKKVVDALKAAGTKPFLFDSPVKYNSDRNTVEGYLKQCRELGFTEAFFGCPVVVSNESIGIRGEHLTYQVCRHLAEADGVLVLSHFKGHKCSGAGGAIKNLGMGALSRETKNAIHEGCMPEMDGECVLCRECLRACPEKCITYGGDGPCFDYGSCVGCSRCIQNCPQKCLKPKIAEFDTLLADGATAALSTFGKAYFVNVIRNISDLCDCYRRPVEIVLSDIGILMGTDMAAIDSASLDLVNDKANRELFNEIHHKDTEKHIREASRLGGGSMDYEVKDA